MKDVYSLKLIDESIAMDNCLGTRLKHIVVQEMEEGQVRYGWTMFTVMDLNQELKTVDIMAGDYTIVVIMRIYPSTAYRPMVCKLCS